jgi:hypothetical protein
MGRAAVMVFDRDENLCKDLGLCMMGRAGVDAYYNDGKSWLICL